MKRLLLVFLTSTAAVADPGSIGGEVSVRAIDSDLERALLSPVGHVGVVGTMGADDSLWFTAKLDALMTPLFLLTDNSSHALIGWRPSGWSEDEQLTAALFPFTSRRLHLGFSYPLTWGRDLYPDGLETSAAIVELERSNWRAFIAAKSQTLARVEPESLRALMGFAGAGASIGPGFELDLQGAWGPQRPLPEPANIGINLPHLRRGVSARIAYHRGLKSQRVLDAELEGGDPAWYDRVGAQQEYGEGISTFVGLEASRVWNDIADLTATRRVTDSATAAGLDLRLQVARARVQALVAYRSPTFLLNDLQHLRLLSGFDLENADPNWLAHLAADYSFARFGLTPGVAFSFNLPAMVGTPTQAVLIDDGDGWHLVPATMERKPVMGAQLLLRWDPNPVITVMGQVGFRHDPNGQRLIDDERGVSQLAPFPRTSWNGAVTMQGRY